MYATSKRLYRPLSVLQLESYICSDCIKKTRAVPAHLRWNSTVSALEPHPGSYPSANPILHSTSSKQDDALLRRIFDSPNVYNDFLAKTKATTRTTGLFQNR